MAPAVITGLAHQARSFVADRLSNLPTTADITARSVIQRRDGDPGRGVMHAQDINNPAIFALFGLIGAVFVVIGIWFFFWAKNGGFYFKEGDWDDYKTTVLRRRGPNGTILSNATPSTNLGGGSVYKDIDDATTTITESTALSGITAGASDIGGRERRRLQRERRDRERADRRKEKSADRRHVGEDGALIDEKAEREAKDHLRNYRHERPARVGGLNKESDGSAWDGSTNPSESTVSSNLLSNRESTPTSTPTKSGGIRKVYSTADRTADREKERIRAEARRLQDKGRSVTDARRNFSYQRAESAYDEGDIGRQRRIEDGTESRVPGSWAESDVGSQVGSQVGSELGTKTYKHYIPGISDQGSNVSSSSYAEEKRRKRRDREGYRRGRGDDYTDDGR
jgi:hypothetical protein